jgi:hypothetical protein
MRCAERISAEVFCAGYLTSPGVWDTTTQEPLSEKYKDLYRLLQKTPLLMTQERITNNDLLRKRISCGGSEVRTLCDRWRQPPHYKLSHHLRRLTRRPLNSSICICRSCDGEPGVSYERR